MIQKSSRANTTEGLSDPNYEFESPIITIGICVRNIQGTIEQCLESLLNCDYEKRRMEIILVDGESFDNTLNVAKRILEKGSVRFKILSDQGKGLGYARQLVVENASGEYICWVDGDNVLTKSLLKNQVKFIATKPSVGIAFPLVLSNSRKPLARLEMYDRLIPTLNAMNKGKTPPLAMEGTITPLKVLKELGGFNVCFRGLGEDVELINRIKPKGYKLAVNPKARIYHNMRDSWGGILNQMRWYAQTYPRKKAKIVFREVLMSILCRTKAFFNFMKYSSDPLGLILPLHSFIRHAYYLIFYLSSKYL